MSTQASGDTPSPPAAPSPSPIDEGKLRFDLKSWRENPNPLWMREMRQSVRLMRTPLIMMVITVVMVLIMSSIGGTMTGSTDSAEAGQTLFHAYFSMAYVVVTLIGPALAANSIAAEREGKTWEAIMLTGLTPAVVARGKFLSSFTAIGQYVIMLVPVGALPFLFGGIGPFEVISAFIILLAIAALSTTFGLAISAKMKSLRGALLVTLLVAMAGSGTAYMFFGVGGSVLAHELWSNLPDGAPIWLPLAYSRASFGLEYIAYLIVAPIAILGLPSWLLYELTLANLSDITDDRTYGLKRWYIVTMLVVTVLCLLPSIIIAGRGSAPLLIAALGFLTVLVMFCAFLFAGEPIGPSRRIRVKLRAASLLRRQLGPGVMPAARLQVWLTLLAFVVVTIGGVAWLNVVHPSSVFGSGGSIENDIFAIVLMACYGGGFSIFVIGLAAQLRARAISSLGPRILLLVFIISLFAGPWIFALVGGLFSRMDQDALAAASLSPFYVFVAIDSLGDLDGGLRVAFSVATSLFYAVAGLVLLMMAKRRCHASIAAHIRLLEDADKQLAEEDRLRAEQATQSQPSAATAVGEAASTT